MVVPNSSNERPYVRMPTNSQPPRNQNPIYWSIYSNGAEDEEPPAVPPKDLNYNQAFPSSVSTPSSPSTYTRPRYTSFSVYEPQSASMAFPEPQRHRLTSQRSVFGIKSLVRHRGSKSDTGLAPAPSTTSLWRADSDPGSYPATVFTPFSFLQHRRNPFQLAGNPPFGRSP